jgi:type I restriction enzyme S subunit
MTTVSLARLNAPDPETFQADARFALDALPALTTRPDQIKQLRQTILNLAVRGKLVPQDPNDEPAPELLKRLKKAQIGACANEGLRVRPPVAKLSRADMWFDFPESWALSSFDDLFVIVSGVTKGQKVATNEAVDAPYLRVANVQRGHLDLTVIKKITVRKADEERYALRLGDVLMTEGGDWDKLGRAAIWREEIPGCIHQNHIFRVRPPSSDVSSEWVITYVNSRLGRAFFEDASKQTTNLASINMTQLRGCPFPLPPLAEQHRIAAKVGVLMALCDRLEANLTATDATRRRLLDALLAEALAPAEDREMEAAE